MKRLNFKSWYVIIKYYEVVTWRTLCCFNYVVVFYSWSHISISGSIIFVSRSNNTSSWNREGGIVDIVSTSKSKECIIYWLIWVDHRFCIGKYQIRERHNRVFAWYINVFSNVTVHICKDMKEKDLHLKERI